MKNYRIKPEYLDLWGEDATEETILTDDDLEMITRGWETTPSAVMDQLIPLDEPRTMTKTEYITYVIQHTDSFPFTGPMTIESAKSLLESHGPDPSIPDMTPEEVVEIWNTLINDKTVMAPDHTIYA